MKSESARGRLTGNLHPGHRSVPWRCLL